MQAGSKKSIERRLPMAAIEAVLAARDAHIIDLRSPAEFADDHLPGAVNLPLFDDTDRALVGLLYKQFSPAAAFAEGTAVTLERIESLVAEIAALVQWDVPRTDLRERVAQWTSAGIERLSGTLDVQEVRELPARPVVLHCWRGGLRSQATISFLRSLGCERALGLLGGYRSYRRRVPDRIAAWTPPAAFSLCGLTGVGKTLVLRELTRLRPEWTFDLEQQAGHRSSLLGMVGLQPCSQKTFESRICARIEAGFGDAVVFEGESRKVGDVVIPAKVWSTLRAATNIELTASVERRIEVLCADYLADEASRPALR